MRNVWFNVCFSAEIPTAEFEMNKEKLSYLGYFIQDLIK